MYVAGGGDRGPPNAAAAGRGGAGAAGPYARVPEEGEETEVSSLISSL